MYNYVVKELGGWTITSSLHMFSHPVSIFRIGHGGWTITASLPICFVTLYICRIGHDGMIK